MSLCTTARPLYTISAQIFGASSSEATMRPNNTFPCADPSVTTPPARLPPVFTLGLRWHIVRLHAPLRHRQVRVGSRARGRRRHVGASGVRLGGPCSAVSHCSRRRRLLRRRLLLLRRRRRLCEPWLIKRPCAQRGACVRAPMRRGEAPIGTARAGCTRAQVVPPTHCWCPFLNTNRTAGAWRAAQLVGPRVHQGIWGRARIHVRA